MNKLIQKPLPYSYEALEPVISRKIMELHYSKHHAAYVAAANAALEKPEKNREVMRDFSFNANGAMMHEIFWENMRASKEENLPGENLSRILTENFGSVENFKSQFSTAAVGVEGSGWAVLWKTPLGLTVGQLEKHNLLAINGATPILVLDVWEHSYYLDYLNDRKSYVEKWWQVVNWEDVEKRLNQG